MKYLLKATLKDEEGNPLQGKTVGFFHYTDPDVKTLIGTAETNEQGVAQIEYETQQSEYVIAYFAGDETYEASWSNEVELHPEQYISTEIIRKLTTDFITPVIMIIIAVLILILLAKVLGEILE